MSCEKIAVLITATGVPVRILIKLDLLWTVPFVVGSGNDGRTAGQAIQENGMRAKTAVRWSQVQRKLRVRLWFP